MSVLKYKDPVTGEWKVSTAVVKVVGDMAQTEYLGEHEVAGEAGADKLQGIWVFDKWVGEPNPARLPNPTSWSVNFVSNGQTFNGLFITSYESNFTSAGWETGRGTRALVYAPESGSVVDAIVQGVWKADEAYKTIDITSKYDEVEDVETLLKALTARATHIPVSEDATEDIKVVMTSANGVRLKTKDTYSESNVLVAPELEELTVTENGEYTSSKVGYSKVTVDVEAPVIEPNIQPLTVTENGEYTPPEGVDGYAPVSVDIASDGFPVDQYFEGTLTDAELDLPTATKICNYAFYYNPCTISVTMPKVVSIGKHAFRYSKVTKVSQLDSLTSIGDYAFANMGNMSSISLPDTVTSIGAYAFNTCVGLVDIRLPSGMTKIPYAFFQVCSKLALTSLPEGITSIDTYAFEDCSKLALTSLPEGITSISNGAFRRCTALALTSLPSGLTTIGFSAFESCPALALSSLPSGITSIAEKTFYYCKKITLSSLPDGLTTVGVRAFAGCESMTLKSLPETVTSIGEQGFSSCKNIELSSFPSGLTKINRMAFEHCTKCTFSSIPASITSIGANAFTCCDGIKTMLFEGSTSLGDKAFSACNNLTTVKFTTIPTSISTTAFVGCDNLTIIKVPWSVGEVAGAPWGATNATILYNIDPVEDANRREITFTIGTYPENAVSYTAKEGMTWVEFVHSEYNPVDGSKCAYISDGKVWHHGGGVFKYENQGQETPLDVIVEGYAYWNGWV